ncbi:MAG TPA: restriction endonuclease subunit S [Thiobacillus sp.]|nr:restriction endonuclease subunit S [Thiobacillus sp.]
MRSDAFPTATLSDACQLITDGSHFSPTPREDGPPIVNAKDIPKGRVELATCTRISESEWMLLKRQNCSPDPGDVLLSKDGTIGRVVHYKEDLGVVLLSSVAILRPKEFLAPAFLAHVLRSHVFDQQLFGLQSGSALKRLVLGDIKKIKIPIPDSDIQNSIAEVLSTLDDAIEQTEALIAKHQQTKAGLMHDLFTRGVTPDGHLRPTREQAPDLYKESPLGWIPKEWEARPLRDLTIKIADRDHTTPEYVDDGVIMVSPTNLFDDEGIDFAACRNIPLRDHLINRRKTDIEAGDLILHRIGAGLGAVRLVTDDMPEFSILHSMALVRPLRSAVSAEYLLWSFRSYPVLLQMDIGTQSIGVPDLGLDKIGSLLFPVAPYGEQTIIANSLRTQTEAGSAERNRLIKLRQQKHGLMHDLLSGKVRVQQ